MPRRARPALPAHGISIISRSGAHEAAQGTEKGAQNMKKISPTRRELLAIAAAASAASIAEVAPAAAQAGPKPIFPVPMVTIPIVGEAQVFQVRRIYCIGRNYAAHAIERRRSSSRSRPTQSRTSLWARSPIIPIRR
jgi:2-keto-4-pentenoate hydratase/2-oxohepta-3-ene-1,7-dioic acid hydratase in catechol pathway